MSSYFIVRCENHDVYGPQLRRQPGYASLKDPEEWNRFLIAHFHCELLLKWSE